MSLEKVAEYKQEIEKIASRAWKRNLAKIGEKGIDKLVDSGVLDRKKELKGLRRGTNAILGKHNAKMVRNPEHAASMFTRDMKGKAVQRGVDIDNDEVSMLKEQVKSMGAFGAPELNAKGIRYKALAHTTKNVGRDIRNMMNSQIKDLNSLRSGLGVKDVKELKSIPRKDRETKKWTQAIMERHEADEVRMGKKVMKNKKKVIDIGNGNQPLTQFASHLTPKVLMAESANVALAPKATKDRFKHLRNWNASISGHENTEMGALKKMSGNKFQYGKGGTYDKKTANKIEKKLVNAAKSGYRNMGIDI